MYYILSEGSMARFFLLPDLKRLETVGGMYVYVCVYVCVCVCTSVHVLYVRLGQAWAKG